MNTKYMLTVILTGISFTLSAQDYNLDNTVYKTISWNEFFNRLDQNPNLVFFDIRTDGERHDTSQYASNNQGRIRGAKQIDYYQFDKYYPELLKYKNDTIYLYCSHSMRSRRLAKQLSDSAFKNVVSINGGMSYLNLMGNKVFEKRTKYIETSLAYNLISPHELAAKLKDKDVQVIDVRPDSIYYATGGDEQDKSYGIIEGVPHMANILIEENIQKLDPKKEIILIDNYGDISAGIANVLIAKGFKNTGVLFGGLDEVRDKVPSRERRYLSLQYPAIVPSELALLKKAGNIVLLDIRSPSEFSGTDTIAWKNAGRLKDAINIPAGELTAAKLKPFSGKMIILYDYMMMPPDLYKAAEIVKQSGIKNYALLAGGVFMVKWENANTPGKELQTLLDKK